MKRTRKTDGGEKVRFETESKQRAKTLTLQWKMTVNFPHLRRKRQSPPLSQTSMTKRQRAAKVSRTSIWARLPFTRHPQVMQWNLYTRQAFNLQELFRGIVFMDLPLMCYLWRDFKQSRLQESTQKWISNSYCFVGHADSLIIVHFYSVWLIRIPPLGWCLMTHHLFLCLLYLFHMIE